MVARTGVGAWMDGRDAALQGRPIEDCPYEMGSYLEQEWSSGWLDAGDEDWTDDNAMEGNMGRKGLNDVLSNDRSVSRAAQGRPQVPVEVYDLDKYRVSSNSTSTNGGQLDIWKGSGSSFKSGQTGERCYTSHPPLTLPNGKIIYGGSCSTPAVTDADVYIGFDHGMRFTQRHWPWKKGAEVLFKITDMSVPESPEEFKKLVDWTIKQLDAGLKVHAGCIGGHGRTGMFFSAIVATLGEPDAITYVRKHYCKKVVETSSQIAFLNTHYGVTKVEASKGHALGYTTKGQSGKNASTKSSASSGMVHPLRGNGSMWGD